MDGDEGSRQGPDLVVGTALDRLASRVELARTRVGSYLRKTDSGITNVGPYFRDLGPGTTDPQRRQRLQAKLVDYKTERPLEGGEDIRDVVPGTEVKDYLDLPFLDEMHERMGIDIDASSTEEYMQKRNDLFSPANTTDEEVPFNGLVVTQAVVNREKARKLIGAVFDPPPYVVRYRGTDYVVNGHHRVVAEALGGKSGTRARVLEL